MDQPKPVRSQDTALSDLKRDWDGWSSWERRAAAALGVTSFALSLVWLALSLKLVW